MDNSSNNFFQTIINDVTREKVLNNIDYQKLDQEQKVRFLESVIVKVINKISATIVSALSDKDIRTLLDLENSENSSQVMHDFLVEKIPNFDLIFEKAIEEGIEDQNSH